MRLEIDKTKEYDFLTAWVKAIDNKNVIITSKSSKGSYKIDINKKKNKLEFFNPVIDNWQVCTYLLPEEIFNTWYITQTNTCETNRDYKF